MLEIRVLGPLEVLDDGVPRALGGAKQRAVLAILALHANHVVSTEVLVDGLWGAGATARSFNAVQVYVSRLRKIINREREDGQASAVLHWRSPGYLLQLDGDCLDLDRFRRLAHEGTRALDHRPDIAAASLREALELWRGQALTEFGAQPFAAPEIARLEEQHLAALGARVAADLALGRHAELVSELESLVAAHPLHEQLHEQRILSLYRCGRQAEALAAYRRVRELLAEELGVEPSRSLQELETAVLNHDARLDWTPIRSTRIISAEKDRASAKPGPDHADHRSLPEIWNVPPRNPHFIGRDKILTELYGRFSAPTADAGLIVQTLYGMGGVGKSQLAIEYAHRRGADYDLVWWIDAEQPVLIPEQFDRLERRLGLSAPGIAIESVERVKAHLSTRSGWLLIFDNAERAEDIAAYRPAGDGNILVTSRSPGWGAIGGRLPVDVLARDETMALLLSRFPLTPAAIADRLATEFGDLPLAISQAVAYMEQTATDPADYLRQFTNRRAALIARGDVVDYQGRIDTAWDLSLEKLQKLHAPALALLQVSAFLAPEPVPLILFERSPAGADLPRDSDEVDDAVGAAVSFSLVRRLPAAFIVHRLVQAAIRQRLSPEERETAGSIAAQLLAAAHPGDPTNPAHWSRYAALAPHVLAIGSYGDQNADTRRLMLDTVAYLNVNADARAGQRIATDLLGRWRAGPGVDHGDTLLLAGYLTLALFWLGRADEARSLGQDTLPRARRVLGANHPDTLRLAVYLVLALAWTGDADEAKALAADTLARARRVLPEQHPDALRLSGYLALALAWLGDGDARSLAQHTLLLSSEALGPNHPTTLLAAVDLGLGLLFDGDAEQIRALTEDTLSRARDTLGHDHLITLGSAAVLTQALVWVGRIDESLAIGREYLERTEERLGSNHVITLTAFAALASALADSPDEEISGIGQDTYQRAVALLGPDHPITLIAAAAVAAAGADDDQESIAFTTDTLTRAKRTLGPDHPLTRGLVRATGPVRAQQPTLSRGERRPR